MIFKLLYRWFPKAYAKVVFLDQRKPADFSKLKMVFIDSQGRKYYKWNDDFDIPIIRKGHFEKCFKELEYGLSGREFSAVLDSMDQAITKRDSKGNMSPDIAMIGWLIMELRERKETLIHPAILMDMVACLYVREDEDWGKMDQEIHNQKVQQFEADSKTGLYDFFYTAGLGEYVPYLKQSGGDWEKIFSTQKVRIAAMSKMLKEYSSKRKSELS